MDGFMDFGSRSARAKLMEAHRRLRQEYGCPAEKKLGKETDQDQERVALRLGLILGDEKTDNTSRVLESLFPSDWTAYEVGAAHTLLAFHGQHCCYSNEPACERCPLLDLCSRKSMQAKNADEEKAPLPFYYVMFPL